MGKTSVVAQMSTGVSTEDHLKGTSSLLIVMLICYVLYHKRYILF